MIDPDQEYLLHEDDVPDDQPQESPEERRRRSEELRQWLEENMGFRPFGVEW